MKVLRLDDNYLRFNIRTLTMLGMWNSRSEYDHYDQPYTYYSLGLFFFAGMTQTVAEFVHAWFNKHDMVVFTQHFTIVTGMASTMIKIVNLWRRRHDVGMLIDTLNYERRKPCNREFAIYREKIVTSTIRACKLFSLTFLVLVFWYAVFIYGKILFYHKGNVEMLPLSPLIPSRLNHTAFYWLFFIYDEVTFFYIAGTVASHDSLFMVFLIHLGTQLELLKQRLTFCHHKIDSDRKDDFIEPDDDFSHFNVECNLRTTVQESIVEPVTELKICVEHHQQILRYVKLLQDIFSHTLLIQFASSLLMITMIGFQLASGRELSSNEFIEHITLLTCAIFQLFLYCWFGTDIIAKSESISLFAYHSKWYVADKRYKTILKILMCRGQRPIKIRVGYIFEVSAATFVNIVSKCYSALALLQQANE